MMQSIYRSPYRCFGRTCYLHLHGVEWETEKEMEIKNEIKRKAEEKKQNVTQKETTKAERNREICSTYPEDGGS